MGKENGLSRRPDWKVGIENDNDNQTLIKEQWIRSLAKVVIEESKVDIVEKVLWGEEWQIEGGLSAERRKGIYTKECRAKNRDNLATS